MSTKSKKIHLGSRNMTDVACLFTHRQKTRVDYKGIRMFFRKAETPHQVKTRVVGGGSLEALPA